jgi:hypothetical protein
MTAFEDILADKTLKAASLPSPDPTLALGGGQKHKKSSNLAKRMLGRALGVGHVENAMG